MVIHTLFVTEATCVTEMSLLMACWKQNDFNNTVCSKEVSVFYTCVEKVTPSPQEILLTWRMRMMLLT
uniref:CHCH domain-containing protein n=1 Tax=Sinocyclocheilus rhinocerous TaxID=307959 RepID=A0A673GEX7_9TELE